MTPYYGQSIEMMQVVLFDVVRKRKQISGQRWEAFPADLRLQGLKTGRHERKAFNGRNDYPVVG